MLRRWKQSHTESLLDLKVLWSAPVFYVPEHFISCPLFWDIWQYLLKGNLKYTFETLQILSHGWVCRVNNVAVCNHLNIFARAEKRRSTKVVNNVLFTLNMLYKAKDIRRTVNAWHSHSDVHHPSSQFLQVPHSSYKDKCGIKMCDLFPQVTHWYSVILHTAPEVPQWQAFWYFRTALKEQLVKTFNYKLTWWWGCTTGDLKPQ